MLSCLCNYKFIHFIAFASLILYLQTTGLLFTNFTLLLCICPVIAKYRDFFIRNALPSIPRTFQATPAILLFSCIFRILGFDWWFLWACFTLGEGSGHIFDFLGEVGTMQAMVVTQAYKLFQVNESIVDADFESTKLGGSSLRAGDWGRWRSILVLKQVWVTINVF